VSGFGNGRGHTDAHTRRQHVIIKIKGSGANVKKGKNRKIYFLNFGGTIVESPVPPPFHRKNEKKK